MTAQKYYEKWMPTNPKDFFLEFGTSKGQKYGFRYCTYTKKAVPLHAKRKSMEPLKHPTIDLEILQKDANDSSTRSRNVLRTFDLEEIMYITPSNKKNRADLHTKKETYTTFDNYKTLITKLCQVGNCKIEDNCITIVPCMFYLIGKKHLVQGAAIVTPDFDEKNLCKMKLKRGDWEDEIPLHTQEEKNDARRAWSGSCVAAFLAHRDVYYQYGLEIQQQFQHANEVQKQLDTMVEQVEQLTKENAELKERIRLLEEYKQKNI